MKTTKLFLASAVCASMLLAGCAKNGGDEPKTYTIAVNSGGNGEATADKASATEGETVKLTATAAPGCEFVKWTVESGGVTCSPGESANPATFTMPADNVSVKAEFSKGILINGVVWAPCNVDAPGTFTAKPEDAGLFYQWNHKTGWSSSDPLTSSPEGATWISTGVEGDERWAAANDPCPAGWRVPTISELTALCDTEKTNSKWEPLNGVKGRWFTDKESGNSIFLRAAGNRLAAKNLVNVDTHGALWSATSWSELTSRDMYFNNELVILSTAYNKSLAFSIRCVAE